MKTIRSLEKLSFDELYESFSRAFAEYDVQFSEKDLELMLDRRGFDAKLSFGSFFEDQLVSFTFNAIGKHKDRVTAYDTGTGTIKEYSGKGLASKIFEYSIPYLENAGVKQYLLEVLQNNEKAISMYTKQGFEVAREFYYFREPTKNLNLEYNGLPSQYVIKPCELIKDQMALFWDFEPSWQNNFESIHRQFYDFVILGTFINNKELVGYCVFEPTTGDVTQIAVSHPHRGKGIGTSLLKEAIKQTEVDSIKVLNTEISCDSITQFLKSIGMDPKGKQYEMIKEL